MTGNFRIVGVDPAKGKDHSVAIIVKDGKIIGHSEIAKIDDLLFVSGDIVEGPITVSEFRKFPEAT